MSSSFLGVASARAADAQQAKPVEESFSDLSVGPDDSYDYSQHLRAFEGGGVFIARSAPTAEVEAMDEDLLAALEGDGGENGAEFEDLADDFVAELQ